MIIDFIKLFIATFTGFFVMIGLSVLWGYMVISLSSLVGINVSSDLGIFIFALFIIPAVISFAVLGIIIIIEMLDNI